MVTLLWIVILSALIGVAAIAIQWVVRIIENAPYVGDFIEADSSYKKALSSHRYFFHR